MQLVGEANLNDLTIGTFHATCARFLRRDGERVGLGRGFVIYDEDDQAVLIKQVLKELNLDDKIYRPGAVLGAIGKAKNDLIPPDQYSPPSYWHEAVGRALHALSAIASRKQCRRFRRFDYGDRPSAPREPRCVRTIPKSFHILARGRISRYECGAVRLDETARGQVSKFILRGR
jgi:superfamily I DNA/RNA helicase